MLISGKNFMQLFFIFLLDDMSSEEKHWPELRDNKLHGLLLVILRILKHFFISN